MARSKAATTEAAVTQEVEQEPITLVGKLADDPVLRHTASGKPVTTIRVVVDGDDERKTYRKVVCWNRTAEAVAEWLRAGRGVEVIGREQERTYEDADGIEHTIKEVVAFRVEFLPREAQASTSNKELS